MESDELEQELLKVAQELGQAERTKDIATLGSLLAADYQGVGAGGERLTKDDVLTRFSGALEFTKHELADLHTRVFETVGLIMGTVHLSGKMGGQSFDGQFRFTDVCVKRSGRWQIVSSQLTAFSGDDPKSVGDEANDLSQVTHRRLIGILGILLPVLLYAVAGLRPTDGLARWGLLASVSSYYYTGSVAIFVGVLFALSLFLFSYPGYKGVIADRLVGCVGGAAALGVGLFPTEAPEGLSEPDWWSRWMGVTHYLSAVVLFGAFILFSIWLFRKSSVPERRDRPPEKRRRDDVCLLCGIVMIISVLWAIGASIADAPIFLPEAIAILAFAISWLAKGEAYRPVLNAIRRLSFG